MARSREQKNLYFKQRRRRLSEAGICTTCGKRPAPTGKRKCATCIDNARAQHRKECQPGHYQDLTPLAGDKSITRRCTKCEQSYDGDMFAKSRKGLYGLKSQCKNCDREYRKANNERLKAWNKRYRETNREKIHTVQRAHWVRNRALLLHKMRERNDLYRERRITKQREDYAANREEVLRRVKEYQKANPGVCRLSRHKRRARLLSAAGGFTPEQWLEKCVFWGWRCYLCSASLTPQTAQVEHRIPLAGGGTNWIANLAPACRRCNFSKQDRSEAQFRMERPFANFSLSAISRFSRPRHFASTARQ